MPVESALVKEVERTNTAIVNPNKQVGFMSRQDLYTIDMDQRRNCYNCESFSYIARNYRIRKKVGVWEQSKQWK